MVDDNLGLFDDETNRGLGKASGCHNLVRRWIGKLAELSPGRGGCLVTGWSLLEQMYCCKTNVSAFYEV